MLYEWVNIVNYWTTWRYSISYFYISVCDYCFQISVETFFRSIPELGSVRLVCRKFYEVTQPDYFWQQIAYSHFETLNSSIFESLFHNNRSQQEFLRQEMTDAIEPLTVNLIQLFLDELISQPAFSSSSSPWLKLCSIIQSLISLVIRISVLLFYRSLLGWSLFIRFCFFR